MFANSDTNRSWLMDITCPLNDDCLSCMIRVNDTYFNPESTAQLYSVSFVSVEFTQKYKNLCAGYCVAIFSSTQPIWNGS